MFHFHLFFSSPYFQLSMTGSLVMTIDSGHSGIPFGLVLA